MKEETTLQRFLNAYDMGGTAYWSISLLVNLHRRQLTDDDRQEITRLQAETDNFDFEPLYNGRICRIIAELDNALQGLNESDRERYLFGVLAHFAEVTYCLHRYPEIHSAIDYITSENVERRRLMAEAATAAGLHTIAPIFNAEAMRGAAAYVAMIWAEALRHFAVRLDALIMGYGFDLFRLQTKSGICILESRNFDIFATYVGSYDLAKHYLSSPAAHTATAKPTAEADTAPADELPFELQSAAKYFERARAAGYIVGNRWQKTNAQLGYFCFRAFANPQPVTAIEDYFNIRLHSAFYNADAKVKRADAKRRRAEIDLLFEE